MSCAIWWIRRDLRITDNQALAAALAAGDEVLPVFVLDPALLGSRFAGPRRTDFLMGGLRALDEDLRARGSRLIVLEGDPVAQIGALIGATGAHLVAAEADHSPYATQRDAEATQAWHPVPLQLVDGVTARPVGAVRKQDGDAYTVFTPYAKRWRAAGPLRPSQLISAPTTINTPAEVESRALPAAGDESALWPPGERHGLARLDAFVNGGIRGAPAPLYGYAKNRDRPDLDGTSRLSPYLRFGMISSRTAVVRAYAAMAAAPNDDARRNAGVWLDELIWRDFYVTILAEFPQVRGRSFRSDYDAIQWSNNEGDFEAWCAGKTGYPFIDAAMRQLLATGWMHNRARMAVASFLVKDLLIDWRWGEAWFMQQLLDGDPAANNGGWQWSAGTGTDAAPYFRIFNPTAQGVKFDPEGTYIRRWVPELAKVATKFIHEPWTMSSAEQQRSSCRIGHAYPAPVVDHKWARQRTLDAYKAARAG